jgi:hypothetical protein
MTETALRDLADRAAITELLHAYCRALDLMDLAAIPPLFTEECIVSYGPRLESRGPESRGPESREVGVEASNG